MAQPDRVLTGDFPILTTGNFTALVPGPFPFGVLLAVFSDRSCCPFPADILLGVTGIQRFEMSSLRSMLALSVDILNCFGGVDKHDHRV